MATIANLVVNIAANTAEIQRSVGKVQDTLGGIEKSALTLGKTLIAGIGFRELAGFVRGTVEEFGKAEAVATRLTAALKTQGTAVPAVKGYYDELAATFQKTTIYGDDLIRESEALLVQVGGVMPSQMRRALEATTNLASGLGINLHDATVKIAKAAAGQTDSLRENGIALDQAQIKAKGLTYVLDTLESKFGGQARAQIDTTSGSLTQMANSWTDVKEAIGKAIATDPDVQKFLTNTKRGVAELADELGRLGVKGTAGFNLLTTFAGVQGPLGFLADVGAKMMVRPKGDIDLKQSEEEKQAAIQTAEAHARAIEAARQHEWIVKNLRDTYFATGITAAEALGRIAQGYKDLDQWSSKAADAIMRTNEAITGGMERMGFTQPTSYDKELSDIEKWRKEQEQQIKADESAAGWAGNSQDFQTRRWLLELEYAEKTAQAHQRYVEGLTASTEATDEMTGAVRGFTQALTPGGQSGGGAFPGGQPGWPAGLTPGDAAIYGATADRALYSKGVSDEQWASAFATRFPWGAGAGVGQSTINIDARNSIMNDPSYLDKLAQMIERAIVARMGARGYAQ